MFLPSQDLCFIGLALFSMGSGLFKPNLMTAVGLIFEDPKDPRKSKAYSTVYVWANLGILVVGTLCGFIGKRYGWSYALTIVIGIIMGATFLVYKTMRFHPSYQKPVPSLSTAKTMSIIGLLIVTIYILLIYKELFNWVTLTSVCLSTIYMGTIFYQCTPEERKGVASAIGYILAFALFVAFFEQSGSSFNFFLQKAVDREVMGWDIPPPAILSSIGPLFVLLCGATILPLWNRYVEKEKPIEGLIKIGCAFLFAAAGFFTLAFGSIQEAGTLVPLSWIALTFFLQTIGELWIAPISLANISKSTPPHFQSVFISFWTMAIAYGHYLAGIIAQFSIKPDESALESSMSHYAHFFCSLGIATLVIGLLILLYRNTAPYILAKLRNA